MLKSKFFAVMAVLTVVALGAAIVFQSLEMKEYNLFDTLQQRFFPSK